MKRIKRMLCSDRFAIVLGLVIVPLISFVFIGNSEESPLYTSISRIAWVHGKWFATLVWAMIVMSAVLWLTYRMVQTGPLPHRQKRRYFICQSINILLVFIGCIIFPAKAGIEMVRLVNYIHDYLTISAWAMYALGLLGYSIMIIKWDEFMGFLGLGLVSFIAISSFFFIRQVVDPESYVGASAVSEVYIINALLLYLVTMQNGGAVRGVCKRCN